MAELYQVYGGLGLGGGNNMEHFSEQEEEERPPVVRKSQGGSYQQPPAQQPPSQPVYQSQQTGGGSSGSSGGGSSQGQSPPPREQFQNMYQRRESASFFDRMAMKRTDVVKLAVFALVIVLAIAIDRIGTHYLTKYISDNIFTNFQEFMIRLAYPVIVFLIIWIVKSM
jgi:hypothetical protein